MWCNIRLKELISNIDNCLSVVPMLITTVFIGSKYILNLEACCKF